LDSSGKLIVRVSPVSNPAGYSEKFVSHSDWNGLNWAFVDQQYNGTQDFDNYTENQAYGTVQRTRMQDNSGITTWTYDRRGQTLQETKFVSPTASSTLSGTFVTEWRYNSVGLVSSMKYPGGSAGQVGEVVSYTYNAQMSLNSLFSPTNSYYFLQKTAYDASGRVDYRYLGAANSSNNPVLVNNYSYYGWDTQGGRLRYLQSGVYTSTTNLQNFAYIYDDVGNINSIVDYNAGGTQTQAFTYDAANRLHTSQASGGAGGTYSLSTYGYSSSTGNLTFGETHLTYNAQVSCTAGNRTLPHAASIAYTSSYTYTYSYDCNGNMIARNVDNPYSLAYDAENRLTGVTGSTNAAFLYDGDGNRVKGTVGSTTTIYIGNYFEWTGSTDFMKKYYYAGSTRVAMRIGSTTNPTAQLTYLLDDHLGSTSVTTNSSGTKVAELRYKPLGRTRYTSGSTLTTYRFTGQRAEASVGGSFGLYFYGSRWFDPLLGRFISPDSIIPDQNNPQSWDRYEYVFNNPVRYNDPNGHCPWCIGAAIGGLVGAVIGFGGYYGYTQATHSQFNWGTAAIATGIGAAGGALIGTGVGAAAGAEMLSGATVEATAGAGAATAAATTALNATGGDPTDEINIAKQAAQRFSPAFAQSLGQTGETLSGVIKNTTRIESLTRTANYRIPDQLIPEQNILSEVKNVGYQAYTNQIKDFLLYSHQEGLKFELIVRQNTIFSKPLQTIIDGGEIIPNRYLPNR
jgi:RHS repeat-associated protein